MLLGGWGWWWAGGREGGPEPGDQEPGPGETEGGRREGWSQRGVREGKWGTERGKDGEAGRGGEEETVVRKHVEIHRQLHP